MARYFLEAVFYVGVCIGGVQRKNTVFLVAYFVALIKHLTKGSIWEKGSF